MKQSRALCICLRKFLHIRYIYSSFIHSFSRTYQRTLVQATLFPDIVNVLILISLGDTLETRARIFMAPPVIWFAMCGHVNIKETIHSLL